MKALLKFKEKDLWAESGLEMSSLPQPQNAHYLIALSTKIPDPSARDRQRLRTGQDLAITPVQSEIPLKSGTVSIGLFMPRSNPHCHQVNTCSRNSEKPQGDQSGKETKDYSHSRNSREYFHSAATLK